MKILLLRLGVLSLLWTLVGCEAPGEEPLPAAPLPNPMIEAGQTTQPVGAFVVVEGSDTASRECIDCEPDWPHACSLLDGAQSVVLIQLPKQEPVVHLLPEDECSGPYSNNAVTTSAEVLGVAWGESVPQYIQITRVIDKGSANFNSRIGGWYYFVNLRSSRGEYFAVHSLRVHLEDEQLTPAGTYRPFPSTFEGVVEELANTRRDFGAICPRHASWGWTDEEFDRQMRDARSTGYDCIPDAPPAAEPPLSEECTDLFPCDP